MSESHDSKLKVNFYTKTAYFQLELCITIVVGICILNNPDVYKNLPTSYWALLYERIRYELVFPWQPLVWYLDVLRASPCVDCLDIYQEECQMRYYSFNDKLDDI